MAGETPPLAEWTNSSPNIPINTRDSCCFIAHLLLFITTSVHPRVTVMKRIQIRTSPGRLQLRIFKGAVMPEFIIFNSADPDMAATVCSARCQPCECILCHIMVLPSANPARLQIDFIFSYAKEENQHDPRLALQSDPVSSIDVFHGRSFLALSIHNPHQQLLTTPDYHETRLIPTQRSLYSPSHSFGNTRKTLYQSSPHREM